MALISCPECGNEVSDRAPTCPRCGVPLASAPKDVMIHVEKPRQQIPRYTSRVFIDGKEVASGKQGQTITVPLTEPAEVTVKPGSGLRKKTQQMAPGERWMLRFGTIGFYWERVDRIAGF